MVFIIHSLSPTPQIGDSRLSSVTAWQFLSRFNLHLEGYPTVTSLTDKYDVVSHGGHVLPFFPWPTMLFMGPADLLYALTGHNPGNLAIGSNHGRTWILEVPTASLIVALTTVVVWFTVLGLNGTWGRPRVAVATALMFAFCTSAWSIGSRALWQQTMSMFFLAVIVLALQRLGTKGRWPWILGVLLALSIETRPTNAPIVIVVMGYVAWRRRPAFLPVILGFAVCMVPFLSFSFSQYGQFLPPYYQPGRLGQPAPFSFGIALLVNAVSPSRGLIIYDPVVLLAALGVALRWRARRLDGISVIMILGVLIQWVVIATYGSTGGATYGPRLMLDSVPFLALLSVPAMSFLLIKGGFSSNVLKTAVAAGICLLLAWGLFINSTGAVLRSGLCWSDSPVAIDSEPSRVWSVSDAQFLRPYHDMIQGVSIKEELTGSCAAIDSKAGDGSG